MWEFSDTEKLNNFTLQSDALNLLEQLGTKNVYSIQAEDDVGAPEGPYFLRNGKLHAAYRLYPDTVGAFIVSTVRTGHDAFQLVN